MLIELNQTLGSLKLASVEKKEQGIVTETDKSSASSNGLFALLDNIAMLHVCLGE